MIIVGVAWLVSNIINLKYVNNNIIKELLDNYDIFLNKKKDRILSSRQAKTYKGTFSIKNYDYGFISNPYIPDLFVSRSDSLDAMNQDYCLYKLIDYEGYGKGDEAVILKVLKRKSEYLVGEVRFFRGKYYLYIDGMDYLNDIIISDLGKAKRGDIVRAKILKYGHNLSVEVSDILGDTNTIGIDITKVLASYNVPLEFSEEVLEYANNIDYEIKELETRKRFDNELIFTIDGLSAKDLDDAISIRKELDYYKLNVYIADVSFYVKEDSVLDKEALSRGTSIYPLDRVVPMLPVKLSNDLCSLNPNEDKRVIALEMTVNNKGEVIDRVLSSSVIKTTKRLCYEYCNDVLENGLVNHSDYDICLEPLKIMVELKDILKEKRHRRGSIDFDIEEVDITLDNKGKAIGLKEKTRGISEQIIEEFMILANETVASIFDDFGLPFIYRVHDKPDNIKYLELKFMVKAFGYNLGSIYPKEVQKLLEYIDNENAYLKNTILRLMSKAIYSTNNIGHFGLASSCYTHFTSPIRRYPDLIVHRLIRKYLFNNDNILSDSEALILTQKLDEIAKISSDNEKVANDIEFKVIDMKIAEYMESFIGTVYIGTIVSIHKFGMFVSIGNTIEGLVSSNDLSSNNFIYNESNNCYINRINKKKLVIGSDVKVKLMHTDKKKGEIDFVLVYNNYKGVTYGKSKGYRKK